MFLNPKNFRLPTNCSINPEIFLGHKMVLEDEHFTLYILKVKYRHL